MAEVSDRGGAVRHRIFDLGPEVGVLRIGTPLEYAFPIRLLGLFPDHDDRLAGDIQFVIVVVFIFRCSDSEAGKHKGQFDLF